jgi:cyclohexyl-isocyanide hydratase
MSIKIGILVFPNVQPLDAVGPFEAFAMDNRCDVKFVWKSLDSVQGVSGLTLTPHQTLHDIPYLDVLVIPGGKGVNVLLDDEEILTWIREQAQTVRFLTSVCTGSLVLGAAGLLKGKQASSHWNSLDLLAAFEAIPISERIVRDGQLITAGGVTAGIDFALVILSELFDQSSAEIVQLCLEYAPAPPFTAGHPSTAREEIIEQAKRKIISSRLEREAWIEDWKRGEGGKEMI